MHAETDDAVDDQSDEQSTLCDAPRDQPGTQGDDQPAEEGDVRDPLEWVEPEAAVGEQGDEPETQEDEHGDIDPGRSLEFALAGVEQCEQERDGEEHLADGEVEPRDAQGGERKGGECEREQEVDVTGEDREERDEPDRERDEGCRGLGLSGEGESSGGADDEHDEDPPDQKGGGSGLGSAERVGDHREMGAVVKVATIVRRCRGSMAPEAPDPGRRFR